MEASGLCTTLIKTMMLIFHGFAANVSYVYDFPKTVAIVVFELQICICIFHSLSRTEVKNSLYTLFFTSVVYLLKVTSINAKPQFV